MEVINMHINPYDQGNIFNHDPLRTRKLLLHKKEIKWFEEGNHSHVRYANPKEYDQTIVDFISK